MHRQQLQRPARKLEPQPPQLLLQSCVLQQQQQLLLLQEGQVRQLLLQDAPVPRQHQLLQEAQLWLRQQQLLQFLCQMTAHPARSSGAARCWTYAAARWCHTRRS
jgi:hypothetical protein